MMKTKHKNIPIFIPHEGCPNCCVFCSQRKITGVYDTKKNIDDELKTARNIIEESLETIDSPKNTEIAFFGGSFTAIDESRMISLLELANEYLRAGRIDGIRLSTRPDFIDEHKLSILKKYGVTDIELGVQSMSETVLKACKRGHSASISEKSGRMIVENGFNYVGQMMIALPESTLEDELRTAKSIIDSGAKFARIYPTVVIENTELHEMYLKGEYTVLELDETVERAARVLELFEENGVKVLRIGLQSSEEMEKNPFFVSAFGELAWGRLFYRRMSKLLETTKEKNVSFVVGEGYVSKAVGQRRENVKRLEEKYGVRIKVKPSKTLEGSSVLIENNK